MKLTFLFTGKTETAWIQTGLGEYLSRLKHYADVEVLELLSPRNAGRMEPAEQNKTEGELQLSKIRESDYLILLDERGKEHDSTGLAAWLEKLHGSGQKRIIFLVGGPFGFSPAIYKRANAQLSLSRGTFSHQMVRVILAEQIYRAFTIIKGKKYHHG
ncbi:MAG TPA: 23S rRNA (pseudouridine(1915)-N(3))-methyltransferase RlmH [Bacteroidia bacterium]|nr:23S rRNA (pseudouridine(1915)-N(3))-methyltransferase RlmH [Bacteroidia bacterium]